jgi:hypothetical protein
MDPVKTLALLNLGTFLVLIILILIVSLCFMINLGKPPDWMVRIINKGILLTPKKQDLRGLNKEFKYRLFPFRYSVFFGFTVAMIGGLVITPKILVSDNPVFFTYQIVIACFVAGYMFLGLAAWLHLKEGSNRKNKYELIISGMTMLYIGYHFLIGMTPGVFAKWQHEETLEIVENFASEFAGELFGPALWLVVIAAISSILIRRRASSGSKEPGRIINLLYKCRFALNPSIWLSISLFAWGISDLPLARSYAALGILLMPVRYFVLQRMLETPIIYLRSFSYAQAPVVLGKIVMPAARFLAPVLAISHDLQAADQIYRRTDPTEQINLIRAPDKEWREQISQQLTRSLATIIDYTLQTEGVVWELEEAMRVVQRNRIIVLQSVDAERIPISDIKVITYSHSWRSQRKAKKELKHHLKDMITGKRRLHAAPAG